MFCVRLSLISMKLGMIDMRAERILNICINYGTKLYF